ncbi:MULTISPECIES: GNAT family N-acetyltransferase [Terrabacteria group]|uniref:GNAT family N-acetyltransferase n=1 Tax=Bacillati TaxID=1783272 RepID=UPI001939F2FE|nr:MULTISPECIES: GNAT family protein [Terrabacteria group]MBW9212720.1 GNAT family N-acetyltransferase [Trueperella sp. zg.1013]QRG86547.1 GNAT family N-acetyltransferase [Bulleidia sp. zg-1006]
MKELIQYRKQLLEGNQIRLRGTIESDKEIFAKWWNEDSLLLGNRSRLFPTYEEENKKLFTAWSGNEKKDGFGLTIENLQGEVVGHLSCFGLLLPERIATLGIFIGPEFQGLGYGSEAMKKGIKIVFEELNAHKAEVNVFSYNASAIHVYEKVGFVKEGVRRAASYHHGQYYDVITMGILEEEYYGKD